MKNLTIVLAVLVFAGVMSKKSNASEYPPWAVTAMLASMPTLAVSCSAGVISSGHDMSDCPVVIAVSSVEVILTLTLLKEMNEVKAEAFEYISTNDVTPALESVVQKIQAAAIEQGKEVSFDEVIDALIQM